MRKHLITLPKGINPGGFLTIKKMSEISGFDEVTIRSWRRQPGSGLKFYRVRGRLVVKCDEFINWINIIARQVPSCKPLEAKLGRGTEAPGTRSGDWEFLGR
jgi:hypothetical protein